MDETPQTDVIDFIFAKYSTKHNSSEQNDIEDDNNEIDESAIKTLLDLVSGISTEFDPEAFDLLQYYFIVTRSVRPSKLDECNEDCCFFFLFLRVFVDHTDYKVLLSCLYF